MTPPRSLLLFPLCLLVLPGQVRADGIHIQHITLSEVLGSDGLALQVSVQSAPEGKSRAFKARIDRVWRRSAGDPLVGKVRTFRLPREPKLVPGAWIVVRRYWDLVPDDAVRPGATVILLTHPSRLDAPRAVVPPSPRMTYKLGVHLTPRWERTYRRKARNRALARDLADLDLYEPAYEALRARRRLGTAALVRAAMNAPHHDLIHHHLARLTSKERPRFLLAVARRSSGSARLKCLLRNHFEGGKLRRDELPALLAFLRVGLDRGRPSDVEVLYALNSPILAHLESSTGRSDAARFIDHFAAYVPVRPDYDDDGKQVSRFHDLLPARARSAFCLRLMRGGTKGKLDRLVVSLVLRNAAGLPPVKVIGFLGRVEPHLEAGDCGGPNDAVARAIVKLAQDHPGLVRRLGALARSVLAKYTCNVDDRVKASLTEIGRR